MLSSPAKVAHALNWQKAKGSILSLAINQERIDMAVSSHPSAHDMPHPLTSIPFVRTKLRTDTAAELKDLVKEFRVCGMVVNWPVQKEGWCGKACGRVLYALDELSCAQYVPVCLWDPYRLPDPEDGWGRAAVYSRRASDSKKLHLASTDQYEAHVESLAPLRVWDDFYRAHWPELYQLQEEEDHRDSPCRTHGQSLVDMSWLESDPGFKLAA